MIFDIGVWILFGFLLSVHYPIPKWNYDFFQKLVKLDWEIEDSKIWDFSISDFLTSDLSKSNLQLSKATMMKRYNGLVFILDIPLECLDIIVYAVRFSQILQQRMRTQWTSKCPEYNFILKQVALVLGSLRSCGRRHSPSAATRSVCTSSESVWVLQCGNTSS